MILAVIIGFLLGVFVPLVAGRFGKILPADPGLVLVELFHRPVFFKKYNSVWMKKFKEKRNKLYFISVCWGLVLGILFGINFSLFEGFSLFCSCVFVCWELAILCPKRQELKI